jgi:hypothetical protein
MESKHSSKIPDQKFAAFFLTGIEFPARIAFRSTKEWVGFMP